MMDITIKRDYYALKGIDGLWHIFERERILSPTISVADTGRAFENKDEMAKHLDELNAWSEALNLEICEKEYRGQEESHQLSR